MPRRPQVPVWWLFGRWARAKRGRAARLVREGVLCDGVATDSTYYRGTYWSRIELEQDGRKHWVNCPLGAAPADIGPLDRLQPW